MNGDAKTILNSTCLNKMQNLIHGLASIICLLILGNVVLFGLFFTANYDFGDFPYFSHVKPDMVIYFSCAIFVTILGLYIGKRLSWNPWVMLTVYALVSIAYIVIIPLEPFSDMGIIWNIATNGLKDSMGYLSNYHNQIPIVLFLWIISSLFGKSILVPKIINVLCNIMILLFIQKQYALLSEENDRQNEYSIIWFAAPFLPVVLYENHIYNDILFTFLFVVMVYFVLSYNGEGKKFVIICVLSVLQYLLRPSGIINIIAAFIYAMFYWDKWRKGILFAVIVALSITGIGFANKMVFHVDSSQSFSVWSYIQMGVNEEEFGFQDGTHSKDWTFQDCVEKYRALGPRKVLKIWMKKELWMWLEGTYQAERYSFGGADAQYSSENPITISLRDIEHSRIRIMLEKFMKAQYYFYMLMAFVGILQNRRDRRKYDLFFYTICGFFCFYLIWEIKSRYIYSLYPVFMIFGFDGLKRLSKLIKLQGENR